MKYNGVFKDAEHYRDMIRFRKFMVHRYEDITGYLAYLRRQLSTAA